MKTTYCRDCGTVLCGREIALSLKLLGRQTGAFRCFCCLAGALGAKADDLRELADYYYAGGCTLFVRCCAKEEGKPEK